MSTVESGSVSSEKTNCSQIYAAIQESLVWKMSNMTMFTLYACQLSWKAL